MSSLVKWVGGKGWLTPFIKPVVVKLIKDTGITSYYEPFAGGLSVYEALHSTTDRNYLGDINSSLMFFYETVREQPDELYDETASLLNTERGDAAYYRQRDMFNASCFNTVGQAARFWYLTLLGYRGLWRVNNIGMYNTPYGNYTTPKLPDRSVIHEWANILKPAVLFNGDYRVTLKSVDSDSFVYLDPPYYGQFGKYNNTYFDYREFFEFVESLPCRWLMSNTNHPTVRAMFKDKRLLTLTKPGGFENKPIKELLIVNA